MRASKLRLPESTAHTTSSPSLTAREIGSGSGPELPMHVVQPYPTVLNPSSSRYVSSPDRRWYSLPALHPGAGGAPPPGLRFTAFFAPSFTREPRPTFTA